MLCTGGPLLAADSGLTISKPWMRFVIPSRPAGGYFVLRNDGSDARVLTGASSPACGMVMMHKSMTRNGVDSMAMVDTIPVPPHKSVTFAPGGFHLMCMKPTKALRPGKTVPMTLNFKDGSELHADFPVRGANGK